MGAELNFLIIVNLKFVIGPFRTLSLVEPGLFQPILLSHLKPGPTTIVFGSSLSHQPHWSPWRWDGYLDP